ncbi:hypothetical protein [Actinophytocola xanthii]|uniref:hypothetical protein n=1 Tax=Actinophytocola xanthii TaxID=1912961 RepID=UPI001178AAE5|nr:hypothetical protein [Actinophytocola xanthii]
MIVDGGAIAGYLALKVSGAAGRLVDRGFDSLLSVLAKRVTQKFGPRPVADLRSDPTDTRIHDKVAAAVEYRARHDSKFGRDIRAIQNDLDRMGGRDVIQQFWNNSVNRVSGGNFIQAYRDVGPIKDSFNTFHQSTDDFSHAPDWIRTTLWIGVVLMLAGFLANGLFMVTLIRDTDKYDLNGHALGGDVRFVMVGTLLFLVGLVFFGVSRVGKSTSRRRG